MSQPFDDILNECIERLLHGERIEDCLARYPEQAVGLKPLLDVVNLAAGSASVAPRPEFRAAARQRLASRVAERRRTGSPAWAWLPRLFSGSWTFRPLAAAAVLLFVSLSSGALIASAGSLPGEPLYPVKLATERARLWATTDEAARAAFHAELADQRLDEAKTVLARRGLIDPSTMEAAAREAEQAADLAEQAGTTAREPVFNRVADATARQQQILADVIDQAPPAARPGLERALEASRRGQEKASRALSKPAGDPAKPEPVAPPDGAHPEKGGRREDPRPSDPPKPADPPADLPADKGNLDDRPDQPARDRRDGESRQGSNRGHPNAEQDHGPREQPGGNR